MILQDGKHVGGECFYLRIVAILRLVNPRLVLRILGAPCESGANALINEELGVPVMYAMQYEITLPADYDMNIIRNRVKARGSAFDHFKGLGLKAFLIRERGKDNSAVNQYAPFYLWSSIEGMGKFLWGGGGLSGIIESFGRPAVRHWAGVSFRLGPAASMTPEIAVLHAESLPPDLDPKHAADQAIDESRRRSELPQVHSTAVVMNPKEWELVHFTLLTEIETQIGGSRYQVLHLSNPHMGELAGEDDPNQVRAFASP